MTSEGAVRPHDGQSLGGFVLAAAAALGERTVRGVLSEAGTSPMHLVHHAVGEAELANLAALLDLEPAELASRLHVVVPGGDGRRSYFGTLVDGRLIEKRTRRFAPATLLRDPWHRASWRLRLLPFCEESWTLVTDACHACGIVQRWSRAWGPELCDGCASDLADGSTPEVPHALRPSLRLAAGLLHHDAERRRESLEALPAELRGSGGEGCVAVLSALAGVVDPTIRSQNAPHLPSAIAEAIRMVAAVAGAWNLMAGWPRAVLSECDARLARRVGRHGDGNMGATAAFLRLAERHGMPDTLRSAVGMIRGIVAERQSGHVDTREFARLSGVAARNVAQSRRAGRIGSVLGLTEAGEVVPLLPVEGAQASRRLKAEGLMAERAAARLGCTYRGIEELIETGLLVRSERAVDDCSTDRLRIEAASLDALLSAVEEAAGPASGDDLVLPLRRALSSIGGRLKPWSAVFNELLSGALPFALATGDRPLVDRVLIGREDVDAVRLLPSRFDDLDSRFDRHMTKKDAHSVLNVEGRYAGGLLDDWVTSTGPDRTVPVKEVLQLAGRLVSSREIAARTGRSAHGMRRIIDRPAERRRPGGLLDRAATLERAEDRCDQSDRR